MRSEREKSVHGHLRASAFRPSPLLESSQLCPRPQPVALHPLLNPSITQHHASSVGKHFHTPSRCHCPPLILRHVARLPFLHLLLTRAPLHSAIPRT